MIKENKKLLINCAIVFVLQILALIWKPFVFVELLFLITLIAFDNIENKICYLFFMLPFYNVFRYDAGYVLYQNVLSSLKSMYLSIFLVLTFCIVMFVKYIVELKGKTKRLNWKNLLIWAVVYILLIIPVNKFSFETLSSLLTITSLFASVYLIFQYKDNFNLKKILYIWLVGVILSVILYFCKGILPHLNSYLCWFDNRFFGIHRDPNYYAFELITILIGYTFLFFKKQVGYEFFVIASVVVSLGLLSLSKSFLISFAIYAFVCLIYLLRYLNKRIEDKKKKRIIFALIIAITTICIIAIVALIAFRLWSERDKSFVTEGLGFVQMLNALTTGRVNIWIDYTKLFVGSFINLIFGYGALNGYPYQAIHNSLIQLMFFGGIVEFILLVALLVKGIKNNKQPMYVYWLTSVLCIFSLSIDLLFSYRTYLIIAILILMFNNDKKKNQLIRKGEVVIEENKDDKNYLISIIIPVYKVEKYLNDCINSIVNQTYKNLEIILVDDGSPDNCPQICDEWSKKDKRIKVVHKENGGVSSARNIGIENATGDYIAFLDSDDTLTEEFSECIKFINNDDFYCFAYNLVDNNVTKFITSNNDWLSTIYHNFNKGKISPAIFNSVWSKMIKKDLIVNSNIKFDTNIKVAEDFLFCFQCFAESKGMNYVNIPCYNYIQHEESVMHNIKYKSIENVLTACEKTIKGLDKITDKNSKKFAKKWISDNLLTVLNKASDFTDEENTYLQNKLKEFKNYINYGSVFYKKVIVLMCKVFSISFTSKAIKWVKKFRRRNG